MRTRIQAALALWLISSVGIFLTSESPLEKELNDERERAKYFFQSGELEEQILILRENLDSGHLHLQQVHDLVSVCTVHSRDPEHIQNEETKEICIGYLKEMSIEERRD